MGSNTLGGRSLVAIGLAAPFPIDVIPQVSPLEFFIEEPGVAGCLILPQGTVGRFVTSFKIRGQELISGVVPFTLFKADNPVNPLLGYAFDESTRMLFNAYDTGAPTTTVAPSVTALRCFDGAVDKGPEGGPMTQSRAIDDEVNAFGRRPGLQLAIGPSAETATLAAGATVVQQMIITRPGRLGHLHVSPEVPGLDVIAVEIQNDGIVNGQIANEVFQAQSMASPGFGHKVSTSTIVDVTLRNHTGGAILNVCACFTMLDEGMSVSTLVDLRQAATPNVGDLNLES